MAIHNFKEPKLKSLNFLKSQKIFIHRNIMLKEHSVVLGQKCSCEKRDHH